MEVHNEGNGKERFGTDVGVLNIMVVMDEGTLWWTKKSHFKVLGLMLNGNRVFFNDSHNFSLGVIYY